MTQQNHNIKSLLLNFNNYVLDALEIMKMAVSFTKPVSFIDCCFPASFYRWLKCYFLIDKSLPGGMAIGAIDEMSKEENAIVIYCEIPLGNLF